MQRDYVPHLSALQYAILMYKPTTGRWLTFLVAEEGLDWAIDHHSQHHDWEKPNAVTHHKHHQQVHGHRLPWS